MKILIPLFIQVIYIKSLSTKCQFYLQNKNIANNERKSSLFLECIESEIEQQGDQGLAKIEKLVLEQEQKIFIAALDRQIKRLEEIEDYVVTSKSTCEPTLKWAQNMSHIFITAKLSHRWDSPPCLKSVSQKYQLTNSTILFENICLMNNVEINFHISQQFFKETADNMTIKKDGVGTYSITVAKTAQQIWISLFADGKCIPIWEEVMDKNSTIKQKYTEARKTYEQAQAKLAKSDI